MLENRNPQFNPPLEAKYAIARPGGGIAGVSAANPIQFLNKTEIAAPLHPLAQPPPSPITSASLSNSATPPPSGNGNNQIDGVGTLEWIQKVEKNGGWVVRIDGSVFTMNPGVGTALDALASEAGDFPDRFVAWKRKRDLATTLNLTLGALSSRIRRLRRWLDRQPGLSGDLVLGCRKRGFRFAVARRPASR